jgi:flagellar L-ring protein precursor FlgH
MSASRLAFVLLAAASLGACSSVSEAVHGPQLTAVAYPAPALPVQHQALPMREADAQPASPNSLWRTGANTFFHDQRASRVGDILTVLIDIRDNATVSNETETSRKTGADTGVSSFFGLESQLSKVLPGNPDPAHLITTGSSSNLAGAGSVTRSEAVSLTIAAVVSGVLPNGNLVIQGRQEVRVNRELRELTVAGIVRPEDISSTNTIRHTQIAEARVSYGGRGDITRVQKTPVGQALVESFTPF